MKPNTLNALVAFIEDNEKGFDQVSSSEQAVFIAQQLLRRGMPVLMVLKRLFFSKHANRALQAIISDESSSSYRRQQLVEAILELPRTYWGEFRTDGRGFNAQLISDLISHPEVFELIVKTKPRIIKDQEHPLHEALKPDAYWLKRVRHCIDKKDFCRAFEELKKADRGFYAGSGNPVTDEDWEFTCAASRGALTTLIRELYHAMVRKGLVTAVSDSSLVLQPAEQVVKIVRYMTKIPRDGRKPQAAEVFVPRAGLNMARELFFEKEELAPERPSYSSERVLTLAYEGAMLLSIAEFWRQKKGGKSDARKKAKHAEALRLHAQQRAQATKP